MKMRLCILLMFFMTTAFAQNLIDASTWSVGSTTAPAGFTLWGDGSSNSWISEVGPYGGNITAWKATAQSGGLTDGGFSTSVPFNTSNTYRIALWVKSSGPNNCVNYVSMEQVSSGGLLELDGSSPSIFPSFNESALSNDKWYLVVGYLHPNGYNGGNQGGIYDPDTIDPNNPNTLPNPIAATVDFKFSTSGNTVNLNFWSYLYGCDTGEVQYMFDPRAEAMNGQEVSLITILGGNTQNAADTQAPTAPTLSSNAKTETTVDLSWTGATDNEGVTGYRLYRGNTLEATLGNVTNYQVTNLTQNTGYTFRIRALDAANNESVDSNILNITTDSSSTTTVGDPPAGNSDWVSNNGNISYSGGNVGIDTPDPGEKLEVNGNILLRNSTGPKQIFMWSAGDTNWRIGMGENPGFNRDITTSHVQFLTYNPGSNQGFAIGANGGDSSFEIKGSDHTAFFRGDVGIGTSIPDSRLTVKGKIHAEEVKIDLAVPAPDYVFKENYSLKTLEEVRQYIEQYGHLPNIPSAAIMEANGVELGEMNMKLLEKIEELTLYAIAQKKEIENLKKEKVQVNQLEIQLEKQKERLDQLEQQIKTTKTNNRS